MSCTTLRVVKRATRSVAQPRSNGKTMACICTKAFRAASLDNYKIAARRNICIPSRSGLAKHNQYRSQTFLKVHKDVT